jgi:excisionase family DNA binding protein
MRFEMRYSVNPAARTREPMKAYLTEKELAERLSVSVKWLQKMRLAGGGIPYCKFGSAVRYPLDQVIAFEEASLRASTSDAGA